jgi:predicted outer membrane repeat protein
LGQNVGNLKTFNLPDNVELYGGFKAGMKTLAQRDPDKYVTTLSGDLMGNDINNSSDPGYAASKADNAWHVITAANDVSHTGVTAKLDGITVIDGYAAGPAGVFFQPVVTNDYSFGGGLYINFDSNITLNDMVFKHNSATGDAGGVFSNNSDLWVTNSFFTQNSAVARAGALEAWSTFEGPNSHHTAIVENSVFTENTAFVFGGAIVSEGTLPNAASSFIIKDSTFLHNSANEGGAIVIDSLNTSIIDSTFIGNVGHVSAGAIATTNVVDTIIGGPNSFVTTISGSLFKDNVAEGDLQAHAIMNGIFSTPPLAIDLSIGGGALVNYMNGVMNVKDSVFIHNTALNGDGGAILNGGSYAMSGTSVLAAGVSTVVSGSLFLDNQALHGDGGAIASDSGIGFVAAGPREATVIAVKDSLFSLNSASGKGGGIALTDTTATIKDNIMFSNNAGSLGDDFYAKDSVVNGQQSSLATAVRYLSKANKILLLDHDDISMS